MEVLAWTGPTPPRSRFELVRRLGGSRTTEVHLAVVRGPLGFERTVVLKRLADDLDPEDRISASASIGREALAYARLAHPAIVRLFDFVEDAGQPTLVLEHVDGLTLTRVIAALAAAETPLDGSGALYIGYRVFLALAAAHGARDPVTREYAPVIHRDLSPDNVVVPWDGHVKLTDFGVARVAGVAGDTRPGLVKGTIGYLAPEQVYGEAASVRTDVYGGCLLLRELILGAPVFSRGHRSELDILRAMASPDLEPIGRLAPGLPSRVANAIDRGLEPDPERRTVTAEEMVAILRSATDIHAAREQLALQIGRLRRAEAPSTPRAPDVTRPEAPPEEDVADTSPMKKLRDSQDAITSRPPAMQEDMMTSMVVPKGTISHPSGVVPVAAPPPPRLPFIPTPAGGMRATYDSQPRIIEAPWMHGGFPRPEVETTKPPRRPPARSKHTLLVVGAVMAIAMGVAIGGALGFKERLDAGARARRQAEPRASAAADAKASAEAKAEADTKASAAADAKAKAEADTKAKAKADAEAKARAEAEARAKAEAEAKAKAEADAKAKVDDEARASVAAALPPGTGRLVTLPSEAGHRIFVDGRFAGAGGGALVVRCGRHDVRVGSQGRLRKVEIPCGGDVEVSR